LPGKIARVEVDGKQQLLRAYDGGYGIHGTPDPDEVSKTASHGCIRLTNWDALELARHLRKGTPVVIDE
jgi:lipoprotein-anchoring transpeptidase ErfK/SrfK